MFAPDGAHQTWPFTMDYGLPWVRGAPLAGRQRVWVGATCTAVWPALLPRAPTANRRTLPAGLRGHRHRQLLRL